MKWFGTLIPAASELRALGQPEQLISWGYAEAHEYVFAWNQVSIYLCC